MLQRPVSLGLCTVALVLLVAQACAAKSDSPSSSTHAAATPDIYRPDEVGRAKFTARPLPLPLEHGTRTGEHFCLVTHYTGTVPDFAAAAASNQQGYARRHGYGHKNFLGRISGDQFVDHTRGDLNHLYGGGLYWQKLTAMIHALTYGVEDDDQVAHTCDWVVWLDSDVIVTNPSIKLEDVVATYAAPPNKWGVQDVDVLLVPDDRHPVSGGVVFVRNAPMGRSFLDAVAALYPAYKDNALPEQTAMATVAYMAEPWPSTLRVPEPAPHLHPAVVVVPQRAFNSFPDLGRNQGPHVTWQPCDFIAHLAGVRQSERLGVIQDTLRKAATCSP